MIQLSGPPVILVSPESFTGLQTARLMSRRGLRVIGVGMDRSSFVWRSRHFDERIIVSNSETIERELLRLDSTQPGAVVIACSDRSVALVAEVRDRFRHLRTPVPTSDTLLELRDKATSVDAARRAGLPVPRQHGLAPDTDLDDIERIVGYPLVIKPAYKDANWLRATTQKAFHVTNRDELERHAQTALAISSEVITQQWIEGPESNLFSSNFHADANGEVSVSFVARKLRQWPIEVGVSSLGQEAEPSDEEAIRKLSTRLVEATRYSGLGYCEFKWSPADQAHLLVEVNVGRPTGRSAIAEGAGVELLATMYCDLTDQPLPSARTQRFTGHKWIHLRGDLQAVASRVRRHELSLTKAWASWRGPKTFAVWSLRDPLPAIAEVVENLRKAIKHPRPGN